MAFAVPTSLSPSRVEAFTSCPLAFRFASIDRLPEPASIHTSKGSLVHRALELLFAREPAERTPGAARAALAAAADELRRSPELAQLQLDDEAQAAFFAEADVLVERYFTMEDPRAVRAIGIELRLEVEVGGLQLRGIIDRLELDDEGELVVTDYKTGRPPMVDREQQRLGGVHFYAYLCERVFGRRPARIQLLYLSTGEVIETRPSEQSVRFLPRRTEAVYQAVVRACATEDFRPRTGPLCNHCAFKTWCPAFGGDPSLAAVEARLAAACRPSWRCPSLPERVSDEHQFFGPAVAAFDTALDRAFDRIRGNPIADRVFLTASALGDWSLGWHLLGATIALLDERRLPDALRLSATLGVESIVVNQGVKRLFHRHRPVYVPSTRAEGWPAIRVPSTSSFPSGHASAAACAVVLLSKRQPRLVPVWLGLAAVVGVSRCYVRMHHASDVVVGAAIGAAIGEIASLLPLRDT